MYAFWAMSTNPLAQLPPFASTCDQAFPQMLGELFEPAVVLRPLQGMWAWLGNLGVQFALLGLC